MRTPSARSRTGTNDRSAAWSRSAAAVPRYRPRVRMGVSSRQPFHHEIDERQHERHRNHDRADRKIDLVEPQIPDAKRREHMREVAGPAAGQQIDAVEIAERP